MNIILYAAIAYIVIGVSKAFKDLSAKPIDQPGWARNPTLGMFILVTMLWAYTEYREQLWQSNSIVRCVVMGTFLVALQVAQTTAFIWLCVFISTKIFDNNALQITTSIVLFALGAFIALPIVNILCIPVLAIVAFILNLVLPKNARS